jgi:hypothetical protein
MFNLSNGYPNFLKGFSDFLFRKFQNFIILGIKFLTHLIFLSDDCAATHRSKIQIVQNKQLKIIMDRHWRHSTEALHEEAGVPLIEDFSQRIVEKFSHKMLFYENPLILGLIDPYVNDSRFSLFGSVQYV